MTLGNEEVLVPGIHSDAEQGADHVAENLLPMVYDELRRLAAQKLAHESPGQTLQPTALVHEAYLRLVGADRAPFWENPAHFFAAAAEAMRRILVDRARARRSLKRGGGYARASIEPDDLASPVEDERLIELDQALDRLAAHDRAKAELVKLRHFAGLTSAEAAKILGISDATAERHWAYARAWLRREIVGNEDVAGEKSEP
jgi:RNA polymerase sigma factor (TIGR02999 family)